MALAIRGYQQTNQLSGEIDRMFKSKTAFSGFSVDNLAKAKKFYSDVLGLQVEEEGPGIRLQLPGGGTVFAYAKDGGHQPATFTILNFVVDDIDKAVDDLTGRGVKFEHYDAGIKTDVKGIARGQGPDIAWFKDPAGNIMSVLENPN
jgi:catechol 2,3-dioxygenase-like lactoylglutathione lyase family enzyme